MDIGITHIREGLDLDVSVGLVIREEVAYLGCDRPVKEFCSAISLLVILNDWYSFRSEDCTDEVAALGNELWSVVC